GLRQARPRQPLLPCLPARQTPRAVRAHPGRATQAPGGEASRVAPLPALPLARGRSRAMGGSARRDLHAVRGRPRAAPAPATRWGVNMGLNPLTLMAEQATRQPFTLAHALHTQRARFRLTEAEQRRMLWVRIHDWTTFQLCRVPTDAEQLEAIAHRFGCHAE